MFQLCLSHLINESHDAHWQSHGLVNDVGTMLATTTATLRQVLISEVVYTFNRCTIAWYCLRYFISRIVLFVVPIECPQYVYLSSYFSIRQTSTNSRFTYYTLRGLERVSTDFVHYHHPTDGIGASRHR